RFYRVSVQRHPPTPSHFPYTTLFRSGSIVAKELDHERRDTDTFPTYMSFDMWNIRCSPIGSGMLPPRFAGLDLNTNSVFNSFGGDRKSTRLNSSHLGISYAVFCLKKQ